MGSDDQGYTITYMPHDCYKPLDVPFGTRIICNECGREREKVWFGWVRIEGRRDE